MARDRSPSQRSDHRGSNRSRDRNTSRSRSREAVATTHRPRREPERGRRDRSPVGRKELFPDRRPFSKESLHPRRSDKDSSRTTSPGHLQREKAGRDQSGLGNEFGSNARFANNASSYSRPEESSHRHRRSSQSISPSGRYSNPDRHLKRKSPPRELGRSERESRRVETDRSAVHISRSFKDSTSERKAESRSDRDIQPESLQPRKRRRSISPRPSGEAHKIRGTSPGPRRPVSPHTDHPEHPDFQSHSRPWSPERRHRSPRRDPEFDIDPHHRPYRGRSPYPRGPSPRHEAAARWESPPRQPPRRDFSVSPRRDPRRRSPARYSAAPRRSRSRSAHSRGSRRGGSPNMYNNPYTSRGRHPPGQRGYSNSPPHSQYGPSHSGDHRGGWSGYEPSGPPNHGYPANTSHLQHSTSYPPPQSPYHQGPSYGSSHSHHSGYSNTPYRGRGGGFAPSHGPPAPGGRSHFQNLSWTPDKGSRGGVAPSERLPPVQSQQDEGTESKDINSENPESEIQNESSNKRSLKDNVSSKADEQTDDKSKDVKVVPSGPSASSKTSIKFAMKIQSQTPLVKKPNVIQSALKAPPKLAQPRPSPFNDTSRRPETLHVRTQPPSGPRRDDRRQGPPSREPRGPLIRSPIANKSRGGPESWGRHKHEVPVQMAAKGPTRRRKRMVTVTKTHRKVVLPAKKLSVEWAQSEFVYFPKPDQQSVVGAGTYGKVFKAHNVYLSKVVALKTLPLIKMRRKLGAREYIARDKKRRRMDRWVRDGLHLTSLREIKLLKSISHLHQNIVGIREIFLESESCNLVFDYFEFDMHGIIYSSMVTLEDSMLKDLVRQLFQGLEFLHTKANILHRDIKAANILVSTKGQVRITDFGLAKHVKTQAELDAEPWYKKKFEHSNRVITTPYRPPELILGATLYGGEVDVWSAGCVLFEAFLRKLPFQGNGEDVDHLLTIWKILGLPNTKTYPDVLDLEWYWLVSSRVKPKMSIFAKLYQDKVSPHLYHLLRCIFQHDPRKRPTAAQVLSHPFFISEEPLPRSAGTILETVEGEWHELEYKMMRDKERAEVRRKHEDNVILCFLKMKQEEHERKFQEATEDGDAESAARRVDFYKTEREEYQRRLDSRVKDIDEDEDQAKQVAAIKKSHGDMYMDASRRSRYRGPLRDKVDEKLLGEAWKWYDDEKRKGNDPVPMPSLVSKIRKPEKQQESANTGSEQSQGIITPSGSQSEYERKYADYERRLAAYNKRKALMQANTGTESMVEKRAAMSPLVDEPEYKKQRDD